MLGGEVKDVLLLDVTPLSLGIETMGGVFTKLIDRNTTIPTKKIADILYRSGQSARSRYSRVAGRTPDGSRQQDAWLASSWAALLPHRRGIPQIEVTFDIDANGIVHVSAKDKGTGKEQSVTITASSNLSKEDIDKAVREAQEYAAEDAKRKEEIDTRNAGDQMVYQTENTLKEMGDKLDPADKSDVESKLAALKTALQGSDTAAIKSATEELTQAFYKVSEKLYQNNGQQPGPDAGNSNGGNNGGDNGQYYDADYTVVDDDK